MKERDKQTQAYAERERKRKVSKLKEDELYTSRIYTLYVAMIMPTQERYERKVKWRWEKEDKMKL